MREIKFRAYDIERKKLIYQEDTNGTNEYKDYHFKLSGTNVALYRLHEKYNIYVECSAHIMQFTGLKDVNGKDIYEGDIVKRQDERIGVIKYGRYDTTDINGINNIGFYIDWKDDSFTRIDLGFWIKQVEVICNIYENPELLGE